MKSCETKRLVNILCPPVAPNVNPPHIDLSQGDESLGVPNESECEKSKCNDSDVKSCKKIKHKKNKGKTPKCSISSDFTQQSESSVDKHSEVDDVVHSVVDEVAQSVSNDDGKHSVSNDDGKHSSSENECQKTFYLTLSKSTDERCPNTFVINGTPNVDNCVVLHLKNHSHYKFNYDLTYADSDENARRSWVFSKSNVGGEFATPVKGTEVQYVKGSVVINTKLLPKYSYIQSTNQVCGGILIIKHS